MVEPAWAVADIATSGSNSEIESRRFVNIVRLLVIAEVHHVRFPNEFGANRRPVTSSRRREGGGRPITTATILVQVSHPAKVHGTIVRSYQTAMNGNRSLE